MDPPSLADTGAKGRGDHVVGFYDTEAFLVDTVCAALAPSLLAGDATVIVATPVHRRLFDASFRAAGIDLDAAIGEGRYVAVDAAGLLAQFMVDGRPERGRFQDAIDAVVNPATQGGRRLRLFGEMAAVLWDEGDSASALAVGDLWNDLAAVRTFALLCAHPMRAFRDESSTVAFNRICEQHTMVIPSEGYSLLAGAAERSRAVAQLQQQAATLRPEVDQLRAQVREQECDRSDRAGQQRDKAGVRRDRAGVRRDRAGVRRDRAGVQRDRAGVQRDRAGVQRDRAGEQRDRAGVQRDRAGVQRDRAGVQRDQAAESRDQAADRRDQAAEWSEESAGRDDPTESRVLFAAARREAASDRRRASQDRRAGADERIQAELDRGTALADRGAGASERSSAELDRDTALADRGAGASERSSAEHDRGTALSDRGASAREREDSSHDDLTGAYHRGAGFVELAREVARPRRDEKPLVLAFVDVDGLKAVNDTGGHAAGDRMLVEVAATIQATLRSYDLVIRYGGDEFVCVIPGLNIADATQRLSHVNHVLAEAPEHGSVTIGLAELQPDDSSADLVARADAALYRQRQDRRVGLSS